MAQLIQSIMGKPTPQASSNGAVRAEPEQVLARPMTISGKRNIARWQQIIARDSPENNQQSPQSPVGVKPDQEQKVTLRETNNYTGSMYSSTRSGNQYKLTWLKPRSLKSRQQMRHSTQLEDFDRGFLSAGDDELDSKNNTLRRSKSAKHVRFTEIVEHSPTDKFHDAKHKAEENDTRKPLVETYPPRIQRSHSNIELQCLTIDEYETIGASKNGKQQIVFPVSILKKTSTSKQPNQTTPMKVDTTRTRTASLSELAQPRPRNLGNTDSKRPLVDRIESAHQSIENNQRPVTASERNLNTLRNLLNFYAAKHGSTKEPSSPLRTNPPNNHRTSWNGDLDHSPRSMGIRTRHSDDQQLPPTAAFLFATALPPTGNQKPRNLANNSHSKPPANVSEKPSLKQMKQQQLNKNAPQMTVLRQPANDSVASRSLAAPSYSSKQRPSQPLQSNDL